MKRQHEEGKESIIITTVSTSASTTSSTLNGVSLTSIHSLETFLYQHPVYYYIQYRHNKLIDEKVKFRHVIQVLMTVVDKGMCIILI